MSGILQIVAIGGFLLALLGVALIFSVNTRGGARTGGVFLAIFGVVVGIAAFIASQGLLTVPVTQKAVIANTLTGSLERPRGPGISIIVPGVQQAILYPTNNQTYYMTDDPNDGNRSGQDAIRAKSIEGQDVRVNAILTYTIDDTDTAINQLHLDWNTSEGGYIDGLIRPTLNNVVQQVTSKYTAEAIYGEERIALEAEILKNLTTNFAADGITVVAFRVLELSFNEEFTQAIERKEIANQDLQRAQTEAEQARAIAKGQADAAIEAARGDAESTLIRAEAEATALELISAQISANPSLIQYHYIDQLSDNVQMILVPSDSPFLFDSNALNQMVEPDSNGN
jgi:regulator of protease activity HflC (stomatin/prohibitin superfamily)